MTEADKPLRRVDLSDLMRRQIPPQAWAIDGLLPRGEVTLLAAHGGTGKSMLSLSLALHAAAGRAWAGRRCPAQNVVLVSFEDPADRVCERMQRIVRACGLPDLCLDAIELWDATAEDMPLMVEAAPIGGLRCAVETPAMEHLREIALWASGGLLILDNGSDAYRGNPIDQQQVRSFVRTLARLAKQYQLAVLLLVHVSKVTAQMGGDQMALGSAQWDNSCRSRLAIIGQKDGTIEVRHGKTNFGPNAEPIVLRRAEHGVLIPIDANDSTYVRAVTADDALVEAAMKAALMTGTTVPYCRTGPATTWRCLWNFDALGDLRERSNRHRFWSAVDRLYGAGRLVIEDYLTDQRKRRQRLRLAPIIGAKVAA